MKALITGITGQDGSFLAESLLQDGWNVVGMVRRTSGFNRGRIDSLRELFRDHLKLFYGDLGDIAQLRREILKESPDAIFHFAGQSHVGISFEIPETTLLEVANSTMSLLEICRDLERVPKVLLVGSSEVFGNPDVIPQTEETAHRPASPYGCAKSCAVQLGRVYRNSFDLPISTIIPYNHESIRRGENFVTRKITRAAAQISLGSDELLELGNLDGVRDWGYAPEYVAGMRRALETDRVDDYIFATGISTSVREFAATAFEAAGRPLEFEGEEKAEVGRDKTSGKILLRVNPRFFRPADSCRLVGDSSKAARLLDWKPMIVGVDVAARMIEGEFDMIDGREPRI